MPDEKRKQEEALNYIFGAYTELTERLSTLLTQLEHNSSSFNHSKKSIVDKQEAASTALLAVMEFINSFPDLKTQSQPLAILHEALVDVWVQRRKSPLFEPAALHNRPPPSIQELRVQSTSVVALHLLMSSGIKKKDAASKVARLLSSAKIAQGSGKPISANTIQQWDSKSDSFIQQRVKNAKETLIVPIPWKSNPQKALETATEIIETLKNQDIPPS